LVAGSFSISGAPAIDPIPTPAFLQANRSLFRHGHLAEPAATGVLCGQQHQPHYSPGPHQQSVLENVRRASRVPAAPGAYQTPFRGGLKTVTNIGDMTFMLFRDIAPYTVDVIQG